MLSDAQLLDRYAQHRSESAFTELVQRHISVVYSAALRETSGEVSLAEDITQAVFVELARNSSRLSRHPALAGWLYTSVRRMAGSSRRAEGRRRQRELAAHTMNEVLSSGSPDPIWQQVRPVLDDAMHELSDSDRTAVVLRFFEDQSLRDIGLALGLGEDAARKRVDRALEKALDQMRRLDKKLILTREQKQAIQSLLAKRVERLSHLWVKGPEGQPMLLLDSPDYFEKYWEWAEISTASIWGDFQQQIKPLLSPGQQAAYEELKKEEVTAKADDTLLQMRQSLGLTEDQCNRVYEILWRDYLQNLDNTTSAAGSDGKGLAARVAEQRKQRDNALATVLTPEQLDGYQEAHTIGLQEAQGMNTLPKP
jgi:RNA polymerase sigma factor (sigma-70 family)